MCLMSYPGASSDVKVDITGTNIYGRNCRIWTNIFDRKDGSLIVRYKLYETCYDMEITVKYKGRNVDASPYKINGTIQAEDCNCPIPLEDWLHNNNCPSSHSQIMSDLEPFPTVNFSTFHSHVVKKVDKSGSMSVCNYAILNNKIYRRCYGQHVGFKTFVDAILTSLARKIELPNMEMFVNLGDWPLVSKHAKDLFPLFSWCGSTSSLDIVMPTYDITESSLEAMGRVSLDMLSVQGNIDIPWEKKEPKAFWRGRDSSPERLKLIEIARSHPDLFNCSMTNFFFYRDQEHIYGPKEKHISFFKFFDYKYQLCLDGTVAAYRLPYLLAGDGLVLKQDSEYYEHFYGSLIPWQHYVPVKRDLSDLVERVRWARNHDQQARDIVSAAQQLARSSLLPQDIFCYHTVLFKEWSKRLVEEPQLRRGMEEVPQIKSEHCKCSGRSDLNAEAHDEL
ncbi:protein O-glucosyltransferase 2-like isoform X2 [Homalodisca vitripennis]|uniref:protein O-glucosyltransferase 2-like isoform X2 n=1 Tax=Homalodisca vitripennis TaxID=197043 RepID=UPI001EEB420B|nr:protein O-glucosyltransferase 2-like isoform X2 [Homalodisca vitripennis]